MKHRPSWILTRLLLRRRMRRAGPSHEILPPQPGTAVAAQRAAPNPLQRLVDLDAAWHPGGTFTTPAQAGFSDVLKQTTPDTPETARLDQWLANAFPQPPSPGARLVTALRRVQTAAVLLGLLLGFGFMAGLVAYDGTAQVNVLWIIGFALLQALLALAALAMSLGKARRLPLLSDLLGYLPARFLRGPLRRLLDAPHQQPGIFDTLHTPFLLLLTQRFALAFNAAALLALFVYVTVQDIAFGWSTTLDIQPQELLAFVRALAVPWLWLAPAVPTLELVEASQFYRLAGAASAPDPALLGRWWPFLACLWLVYALLPRFLLLRWCAHRWQRAQRDALQQHPLYQRTMAQFVFDQHGAAQESARLMSRTLLDMLTHQEKAELDGHKLDAAFVATLQARWQSHQQQQEAQALSALAEIYLQTDADVMRYASEQDVPDPSMPDPSKLFVIEDWERWGLSRKRLALLAGAGGGTLGAGVGASLDAATGGMSLGSLTAALAAVGAAGSAASVYFSERLARTSADHATVRFGPVENRQYPWVLLGRLITAWSTLSGRLPGSKLPAEPAADWRTVLGRRQESELEKLFALCRKGKAESVQPPLQAALARLLDQLLAARSGTRPQ